MTRAGSTATDALLGTIAGVTATVAMTLAADALFRRLPAEQRYPLPPRELTERAAETTGQDGRLGERTLVAATIVSHFGFGAAAGGLFGGLLGARPRERSGPAAAAGVLYGLAVWTCSYLGWVPALRLLRPATRHPPARNALMIAVHVVWGSVLGLAWHRLSLALKPFAGGRLRDR